MRNLVVNKVCHLEVSSQLLTFLHLAHFSYPDLVAHLRVRVADLFVPVCHHLSVLSGYSIVCLSHMLLKRDIMSDDNGMAFTSSFLT